MEILVAVVLWIGFGAVEKQLKRIVAALEKANG